MSPWAPFDSSTKIALAVTDHDWTIEHVSTDAEGILGRSPDAYKGVHLLGLFHPADVQSLVSAVDHLSSEGGTATQRARLRLGEVRWRDVWCLVVAMCQHSPPRLGLVISAAIPQFSVQLNSNFIGDSVPLVTMCWTGWVVSGRGFPPEVSQLASGRSSRGSSVVSEPGTLRQPCT